MTDGLYTEASRLRHQVVELASAYGSLPAPDTPELESLIEAATTLGVKAAAMLRVGVWDRTLREAFNDFIASVQRMAEDDEGPVRRFAFQHVLTALSSARQQLT